MGTDAGSIAAQWLSAFSSSLSAANSEAVSSLFISGGFLRDVLVFTWDCRTVCNQTDIEKFLSDKLSKPTFSNFLLDTDSPYLSPAVDKSDPSREAVKASFTFETERALCRGAVSLVKDACGNGEADSWKALSLLTTVADWKRHEEISRVCEPHDSSHAWTEEDARGRTTAAMNPTVLIVGAGQGALQVAARLHHSNISCLIVEKEPRVGDNWRKRYPSLKLHVPRVYCQLLYEKFPSDYPAYIPKDLLADWLEAYVLSQSLLVWTSSTIESKPSYDAATKTWTVTVNRNNQHITIHPKHLVMALSTFGDGVTPAIKGQDIFEGSQVHSTYFLDGSAYYNKHVLVFGAGNSASDICVDLVNGQAKSVTLLQRSPTCVHSSKYIYSLINAFFPENVPIDVTDFKMDAMPIKLMLESLRGQQKFVREHDKDMFDGLTKAGFKLTDGPTGAGYIELGLTKGGGYFFDFGFASLVSEGRIRLKTDVEVTRMTERSILFSDESELEADAIVYATGYYPIRETYKRILGNDVVEKTSDVWDLDEEGETRGVYRPTGHPRLWYVAGDFSFARRYSKRLALLIKACELGYYEP